MPQVRQNRCLAVPVLNWKSGWREGAGRRQQGWVRLCNTQPAGPPACLAPTRPPTHPRSSPAAPHLVAAQAVLALQQAEACRRHNAVRVALHCADGACARRERCTGGQGVYVGTEDAGSGRRRRSHAIRAAAHRLTVAVPGQQVWRVVKLKPASRRGRGIRASFDARERRRRRRRRRQRRQSAAASSAGLLATRPDALPTAPHCAAVALAAVRDPSRLPHILRARPALLLLWLLLHCDAAIVRDTVGSSGRRWCCSSQQRRAAGHQATKGHSTPRPGPRAALPIVPGRFCCMSSAGCYLIYLMARPAQPSRPPHKGRSSWVERQ